MDDNVGLDLSNCFNTECSQLGEIFIFVEYFYVVCWKVYLEGFFLKTPQKNRCFLSKYRVQSIPYYWFKKKSAFF